MEAKNYTLEERFIKYVQIDTTADPNSASFPSSMKQKDLAQVLYNELKDLGINDVEMDQWGYIYATIPSTSSNSNLPTICFCSHMDTAPDCSGTDVKPIVHRKYNGDPITLPDDTTQVITTTKHPYLLEKIGATASGLYSHAEGANTIASGETSHAEGNEVIASGEYSHAEGSLTRAFGTYSHAEGQNTTASGNYVLGCSK